MASRETIQHEISAWGVANPGTNPLDGVRKEKLRNLAKLTSRPVLVYASDWSNPVKLQMQQQIYINLADKNYFAEIVEPISGNEVDLIIHSPGGSAEATESIVSLLRSKFESIRIIVPDVAKSAATMLAMSANQLLLDNLSELGPIDPQMVMNGRQAPTGAILKQFEIAENELKSDPSKITAWLPMLQQYGPSILVECQNHLNLSRQLVGRWLAQYMFLGEPDAEDKASSIANWLADDSNFLSHSRRIGIEELKDRGVKILDLRSDPQLREAVRQVYLALTLTFESTGTFKIIENSEGGIIALGIVIHPQQSSSQ